MCVCVSNKSNSVCESDGEDVKIENTKNIDFLLVLRLTYAKTQMFLLALSCRFKNQCFYWFLVLLNHASVI
jgi:hypothetical protein